MADAFLFKNNRQAQIVLNDLHKAAKSDGIKVLKALGVGIFKKIEPHHVKSAYLPISKEQGNFMYDVIVKNQYKHIRNELICIKLIKELIPDNPDC